VLLTLLIPTAQQFKIMTINEAKEQLSQLSFPELSEGDIVWYPGGTDDNNNPIGHRFQYTGGEWVSHPL